MYITVFSVATCFVHPLAINVINFVQYFYEIYITGLKTAELGRNMSPQ